jgi:hypothetical protein
VAQGIAMAAQWLTEGRLEACIVVAAEEVDWLIADAYHHFHKSVPTSEGAGALALVQTNRTATRLECVTDVHSFAKTGSREKAALAVVAQLSPFASNEALISGLTTHAPPDRDEASAWNAWSGPQFKMKAQLGEAFCAGAMWQCVAAIQALGSRNFSKACVSLIGINQSAAGLRFCLQ